MDLIAPARLRPERSRPPPRAPAPAQSLLERGHREAACTRGRDRFHSQVLGPHFEYLCREWVLEFAEPETFGGMPMEVGHGTVADQQARTGHEVDVVVRGAVGQDIGILLSVGEAKWNKAMGLDHLDRLRHVLKLLADRGEDVTHATPACYSGAGFTPELRQAEARGEVILVGLDRLYSGA